MVRLDSTLRLKRPYRFQKPVGSDRSFVDIPPRHQPSNTQQLNALTYQRVKLYPSLLTILYSLLSIML